MLAGVRPFDAMHMTAGPNGFREPSPEQLPGLDVSDTLWDVSAFGADVARSVQRREAEQAAKLASVAELRARP
jgi:hypothetical protein